MDNDVDIDDDDDYEDIGKIISAIITGHTLVVAVQSPSD